jgi:exodeoxyribonuclease VII small subunit
MTKKNMGYAEAMKEIETTLRQIEMEELDVDDLSEKVKRVSVLIKLCKEKLHNTEAEVEKILNDIEP